MNLWATAAQAVVYSAVSISFGMYYKRLIRRDREKLDRIITGVEAVFGITTVPIQKKGFTLDLAAYRKGIAAGFGVILTGLLTWAETANLEPVIGPLVPEPFRPLVGVVLGGIALTASVILTTNKPKAAETIEVAPAPVAAGPVAVPAGVTLASLASDTPFWAGVPAGDPQAATSAVELLPAPAASYM